MTHTGQIYFIGIIYFIPKLLHTITGVVQCDQLVDEYIGS